MVGTVGHSCYIEKEDCTYLFFYCIIILIGVSQERERQGLYEVDKDSKLDKEENCCYSGNGADSVNGVLLRYRNRDHRIQPENRL